MGLLLFPNSPKSEPTCNASTSTSLAEKGIYYITVEERNPCSLPYVHGAINNKKTLEIMWENVFDANQFLDSLFYDFEDWYGRIHITSANAISNYAEVFRRDENCFEIVFKDHNVPHRLFVERGFCHGRAWWVVLNMFDGDILYRAQVKDAVLRPSMWYDESRMRPVSPLGSVVSHVSWSTEEGEIRPA